MDLFCGAELAFSNTYFTPRPTNVLKINTDLPVKTLVSVEVPPSAGSFAYSERGLQNRFILWRAEGSNLFIDEYTLDRQELIDSSLCINFSQSLIIPGTRLFIIRNKILLLIVPTQSGIHRFHVHLARSEDDSLGDFSLISRLHQYDELLATYDFYAWKFTGIASKVAIGADRNGQMVAAVSMADKQLLRVVFPPFSPMADTTADETLLQCSGMLNRLFMKQHMDTWEAAVVTDEQGELRIFNLSRDGKIRVFDAHSTGVLICVELAELIPKWSMQIEDIGFRAVPMGRGKADMVLVHMVISSSTSQFVLLKQYRDKLAIYFSTTLNDIYIKDFLCTRESGGNAADGGEEKFSLWAIVNEQPQTWDSDEDDCQPYTLKKCEFVGGPTMGTLTQNWEPLRPASSSGLVDNLLFKYPNSEGVRNRIFDGNNYSFDVVHRAVQVVCKQAQKHIEYNNWLGLSKHLDEFLSSGQFKHLYLSSTKDEVEDESLLDYDALREDTKLRKAYEKFWSDFLKTCNQLQEEKMVPLAIWHSPVVGLVGVVQMCRFTICCAPDNQMRAICHPSNKIVKQLFALMRPNMIANLRDPYKTMDLINENSDEFCRLIVAFATKLSPKFSCKLIKCRSHHLKSAFTIALAAMGLRSQILARLKATHIVSSLIGVVPQIFAISTEARVNPKLDMVISAYQTRISQLISYYTTMWVALSVRLVSHDQIPKQINVAQAYLNQGFYFKQTKIDSNAENAQQNQQEHDEFGEELREEDLEDGDPEMEMEEEEEEELNNSHENQEEEDALTSFATLPPPSKWDDTRIHQARQRQKQCSNSQFGQFFRGLLDGMIAGLWPESYRLILPRFLAESKFFDALKNYCALNEPFPPELAFAFRFLQAIAHSGQNKAQTAWTIFEEVAEGVVVEDAVLNGLLGCMYPSPSVSLAPSADAQKSSTHSLIEYFNKVMLIFKEHKHTDFVVKAAEKALGYGKKGDELLMSEVYTTLFTQHLVAGNYLDAVRTVLLNPNEKRQQVCLRQLVQTLLDTRQTQVLVALPYDHLVELVCELLEARCRLDSVGGAGAANMYNIAYAFHVSRCEFGRAAKLMYELATRLRRELQTRTLLQRRCNVLATVYQTMQIVDNEPDSAFSCEVEDEVASGEEDEGAEEAQDNGIRQDFAMIELDEQEGVPKLRPTKRQVRKEDVARELLKLETRLALLDADPLMVPPLAEDAILRESLKHKRYDMAWLLIKEFELTPYELLEKITDEAIHIDHEQMFDEHENSNGSQNDENFDMQEPDWVMCNRNFIRDIATGGNQKSHWRIVISYVDLATKLFPHDTQVLRTVASTFLKYAIKLPLWLQQRYTKANFGDLLCTLLDYGDLGDAFRLLLPQIETAKQQLRELVALRIRDAPMAKIGQEDVGLLLPYTHIELLLQMGEQAEERSQLPIDETLRKLKEFNHLQQSLTMNPAEAF